MRVRGNLLVAASDKQYFDAPALITAFAGAGCRRRQPPAETFMHSGDLIQLTWIEAAQPTDDRFCQILRPKVPGRTGFFQSTASAEGGIVFEAENREGLRLLLDDNGYY